MANRAKKRAVSLHFNVRCGFLPVIKAILMLSLLFGLVSIPSSKSSLGQKVVRSGVIVATAYNSLPGQTDSSPWITASGTRCREGVIASNFLPIGTKVMIEGFGGRVFVVEDRMNKRYAKRIDIWFRDYSAARRFGIRKVRYHVLGSA